MTKTFSISVVIPNYNGKELLAQNLPYVYQALAGSGIDDFEIIISDDASTDDSIRFIKASYPEIVLIENHQNVGFAGNTNKGIFRAKKELVLILNSDIQLTEKYFVPLLPYFNKADTFGVMGSIFSLDADSQQVGAKFPGYGFGKIAPGKNFISQAIASLPTYYLSGANSLVNRQKLMQLKGFNESFNPFYYEDVDLSFRAWQLGYKLYYEHLAICRHAKSATIKKEPADRIKVVYKRNKFMLHYLHLNGSELTWYLAKLYVKSTFRRLVNDKNYHLAYQQFLSARNDLKQAKTTFRKLQTTNRSNLTLRDVATALKAEIASVNISIF